MRHCIAWALALVLAVVAAVTFSPHSAQLAAQSSTASCGTDMRVLVISGTGSEPELPAVTQALDYPGIPYTLYTVSSQPAGSLTPNKLANGCHAFYQGVVLTTSNVTGLSSAELQTLASYEVAFAVRQVTWYTWPTADFGFITPSPAGTSAAITAKLTTAGAQVFPYLNRSASAKPIVIQNSWTYLATTAAGDLTTTPLLTDAQGDTLAAVHTFPDGHENLAMTFDSNPYMLHAMLLSYGVVNWVTRGLFIGERHTYLSPQVDDLFIDDSEWVPSLACTTPSDPTGFTTRITGADLNAVANWQTNKRRQATTSNLRLTMAYNGEGTTGVYAPDTLTSTATSLQGQFNWVNHTYDHANLDAITYAGATSEIALNNAIATQLKLTNFSKMNIVQPDVSGLTNPAFLQAAFDNGVRYLISDTSKVGSGDNPTPNTGRWTSQPGIFAIPRRPNNLFFNVATPADWVAEYNCIYYTNPSTKFFSSPQTYSQILDFISQEELGFLLRGELDPWMFHQPNLRAYDGVHTLLSDLLDATLTKYLGYYTLPVVSPRMDVLGVRMANRTVTRAAGLNATIEPGVGLVLLSPIDVTIPITGLKLAGAESYAGQWISWVALKANQSMTLPLTAATLGITAPIASAGVAQVVAPATLVTLAGSGTDTNTPPRPLTFTWTQTSGPAVTLTGPNTATATFTAPTLAAGAAPVTLSFTLTVSNGMLSTAASTTVVVSTTSVPTVDRVVFAEGLGTRTASVSTTAAGELLVALVSADSSTTGGQRATVSAPGLAWALVQRANSQLGTAEIWTARAAAALSNVNVTSTLSQSGYYQSMTVVAFTGASGIGASAAASSASGAPTVMLTSTKAGSLVFGVGTDWDTATARTLGSSQTMIHQYLAPVGDTYWVQTQTNPTAASGTDVTLNDTAPTNDRWNFASVEIVP